MDSDVVKSGREFLLQKGEEWLLQAMTTPAGRAWIYDADMSESYEESQRKYEEWKRNNIEAKP